MQDRPLSDRQSTVNQYQRIVGASAVPSTCAFLRGEMRMAASETRAYVTIRVLGEPAIELDGAAVPMPASLRAVALLGWLALRDTTPARGAGLHGVV